MPDETQPSTLEKLTKGSFASYVNGFLIVIAGFLIQDKLGQIEAKLESIDPVKVIVREHDLRINMNEKGIYRIDQELKDLRNRIEEEKKLNH